MNFAHYILLEEKETEKSIFQLTFFSSGNTSYVFCTVVKGNRGQSRRLRNIKLGKNND